ncbi:MAG TPA: formylglycine-generating enzyme family protein [Bryobacteraceae bacterium]|jgi:formylglycine-generating enzyme required for sulfatase activity|nr:formylglycine-generating enzyme family protein [Bryobacteraceae bacterium]
MIRLDGGPFLMGSEDPDCFSADREGPVRQTIVNPFYLDRYPVTNEQFRDFARATGYKTDAERFGWSFVFFRQLAAEEDARVTAAVASLEWWRQVEAADWAHPEGRDSSVNTRLHHPVTHVSWNDAAAYAAWAGKRLPTETEWEFAARGGLEQKRFPWGDELVPDGRHRCNIWQGDFPDYNSAEDGYEFVAPVDAYEPNGYGFYTITGNVWEWCADCFDPVVLDSAAVPAGRVIRGGSFLCHASYCNRYRVAARTSNTPDSSTAHMGFRCARDL